MPEKNHVNKDDRRNQDTTIGGFCHRLVQQITHKYIKQNADYQRMPNHADSRFVHGLYYIKTFLLSVIHWEPRKFYARFREELLCLKMGRNDHNRKGEGS